MSLDDKRQPVTENDLPDMLAKFRAWRVSSSEFSDCTAKAFAVPVSDIRANKYDLSLSRYKESVQEEVSFDPPAAILARMKSLESEIQADMVELEGLL